MAEPGGGGSGVGLAILATTIGSVMVYSALKGIGITDVLAGKTGDTLDPHGSHGGVIDDPLGLPALTPTPGTIKEGGNWTAPLGGAHGFKGPHADDLNRLAGVAQNTFHLRITATTNGNHVAGSYHYRGEAFDTAGAAADMQAFAKYVYENAPKVSELIHNGITHGYAIKNGIKVSGASVFADVWPGHKDHVHVAWG